MKNLIYVSLCLTLVTFGQDAIIKNQSADLESRINDLVSSMTLEEKVEMISGTGFASKPLPRLGIPALAMTDGPVGVRWDKSVAFPSSIMLAATFDTSLAYQYGRALARETKAKGRNTILGPCVNINRVPNGGRNFESFGEDPFLTSRMAVSYIRGVQNEGVVATVKHFAVNNQETDRMSINAKVSKRALYEIYFPAFQAAVQEAKVEAVMCAYNKLNGTYCSENEMLLNTVLKREWKFDGLVMSDWGAVHSTRGAATHGLDLEMPDGAFLGKDKLVPLVREGIVKERIIDDKVKRMLRVMLRMGFFDNSSDTTEPNALEQRAVALEVARAGIVLLKNEGAILPIDPLSNRSIAVIGPNAEKLRTGGGGSSLVDPAFIESPLDGIRRMFGHSRVSYAIGARLSGDVPPIGSEYFFLPSELNKNGIFAEYFNNKEFNGKPVLTRVDSTIAFHWGGASPGAGIGKDNFSVRWTTKIKPSITGTYEITTASDDGVRVIVNGNRIIDHWSDHAVEARQASIYLEAGKYYDVTVEYYENGGDAAVLLGWTKPGENELNEAVTIAEKSDMAFIFVGNSHFQESEGFDRPSIDLPENQVTLIKAVAKVNKNTIVILNAGAQMNLLPWIHNVRTLLWAFFPGQEGTRALLDVMIGKINPSGKLPFTIAKKMEEYPSFGNYPGTNGEVDYEEGILVGYRYFESKKIEPLFPFGYGLSYTSFDLTNLNVTQDQKGRQIVSVDVKNTGKISGFEVIQVYVHDNTSTIMRPDKELKAFTRVEVLPNATKRITLTLDKSSFMYYDDLENTWKRSNDGYTILVGTSSKDIVLSKPITIK